MEHTNDVSLDSSTLRPQLIYSDALSQKLLRPYFVKEVFKLQRWVKR